MTYDLSEKQNKLYKLYTESGNLKSEIQNEIIAKFLEVINKDNPIYDSSSFKVVVYDDNCEIDYSFSGITVDCNMLQELKEYFNLENIRVFTVNQTLKFTNKVMQNDEPKRS